MQCLCIEGITHRRDESHPLRILRRARNLGETVRFHQLPPRKPAFDVARRYVRLRALREDGYVEFDFAIGDPELAVELLLPLAAYQAFCRSNEVIQLSREQADAVDAERSKWRFGAPGLSE